MRSDASAMRPSAPSRWKRRLTYTGGAIALLGICAVIRATWGPGDANAKPPLGLGKKVTPAATTAQPNARPSAQPIPTSDSTPEVVATVNGQQINKAELAKQSLWHYGKDVLESLVNKYLIAEHCRQRNITITQEELDAEVQRMSERFGLPTEQFLKLLKQDRGINPTQYTNDIIWPTIALRKLAADRLTVSREELLAAFEMQFGPAVKIRMIACNSREKADRIHAMAVAEPDEFGNLAKQHSDDLNSASAKGLVQPVRKHMGDPTLEQAAFSLNPGEISQIMQVGSQFVFLKCEEHLPAQQRRLEDVEKLLTEAVRDKKLRLASAELFHELQQQAHVENIYNDPVKSKQMPGVAAIINERKITIRELAEECIARHGVEVLEGTISRKLLEQECAKRKIVITQADMDQEVARAAMAMGKMDAQGNPDVAAWLKTIVEEQNMPLDLYMHDAVWPTVALKKLVDGTIQVGEEDIRKGFEANFGPRVRCRAIVLSSQKRAQEVWEMARRNPTVEYFGDLAEQYSVETSSRMLRGEVPPIQKWGGEPVLEQEAFALKAGELSGVIQMGDRFVVLLCEGLTTPMQVKFEEVRDMIVEDLREKRLRIAMAQQFEALKEMSHVDNFLAKTSHSPKPRNEAPEQPGRIPLGPSINTAGPRVDATQPPPRSATRAPIPGGGGSR